MKAKAADKHPPPPPFPPPPAPPPPPHQHFSAAPPSTCLEAGTVSWTHLAEACQAHHGLYTAEVKRLKQEDISCCRTG